MTARPNEDELFEEREPYKMKTIARLTDFSPILLRAWERRYKLLQPKRGPGGHRLYTEDDLNVLLRVRQLINSGRSIGEIASMGREAVLHQQESSAVADGEPKEAHPRVEMPSPEAQTRISDWRNRIVQAALAMDERALSAALDEGFASVSADTVIHDLIVPSAHEIGHLWMTGRCTVASEHLATGVFVHRLRKLIEAAAVVSPDSSAALVGACFPEENHELGLLILSYHLARRGLPVTNLGAALPFDDLGRACGVKRPQAVLLSVTRSGVYRAQRPALLAFLEKQGAERLVCVGGAGVPDEDEEVERVGAQLFPKSVDLTDAVAQLVDTLRSPRHGRSRRAESERHSEET